MMCPHRICPKRDSDSYECPARVQEKELTAMILQMLELIEFHGGMEKAINLLKKAKEAAKVK